jgi:REP element-mobilizing transposase RayT
MSRPLRIAPAGSLLHVMSRGNARMSIFLDDTDHLRFLEILDEAVARFALICCAFCLMPNHYHLVIELQRENLSAAMQRVNGIYARWWNRRLDRVGHVFQGRFKAQLVQHEAYFRRLCRYVVTNPVRAGLVTDPAQWRWSSYRATLGEGPQLTLLDVDHLLGHFASRRSVARWNFRTFVEGVERDAEFETQISEDRRIVGDEEFVKRHELLLRDADKHEVPRRERLAARPPLETLRASMASAPREDFVRVACIEHGYRQVEVATLLGLHPSSVSLALRSWRTSGSASGRGPRT